MYYVIRKFNLIGGKVDFQYVSSFPNDFRIGYDRKKEYALKLDMVDVKRLAKYLNKYESANNLTVIPCGISEFLDNC